MAVGGEEWVEGNGWKGMGGGVWVKESVWRGWGGGKWVEGSVRRGVGERAWVEGSAGVSACLKWGRLLWMQPLVYKLRLTWACMWGRKGLTEGGLVNASTYTALWRLVAT